MELFDTPFHMTDRSRIDELLAKVRDADLRRMAFNSRTDSNYVCDTITGVSAHIYHLPGILVGHRGDDFIYGEAYDEDSDAEGGDDDEDDDSVRESDQEFIDDGFVENDGYNPAWRDCFDNPTADLFDELEIARELNQQRRDEVSMLSSIKQ